MGILIVIALFAGSCWIVFFTGRRLFTRSAGPAWVLVLLGLVAVGVFGGGWLLTSEFEYSPSPELRVVGCPIPLAVFHLENGDWIDFVSPPWFQLLAAVTNVAVAIGVAVLPVLLASLVLHRGAAERGPVAQSCDSDES